MKSKFLVSAVLISLSPSVFASKARLQALQRAVFLKDVQTAFINPAHVNSIGNLMTFEFGGNGNTSTPKAEGGIFDNSFGPNLGIYLGHVSDYQKEIRATNGFENQNNPIEIFYGKDKWGASLAITQHDDKTAKVKEQSVTGRFGWDSDGTEIYGSVEAFAKSEKGSDNFRGGPSVELGFEKAIEKSYLYGLVNWGKGENEVAGVDTDNDRFGFEIGALSRRIEHVYYGIAFAHEKRTTKKDLKTTSLPIFAGIEMNLNTWAIIRASITQSVLLSSVEDENQASPADGKIRNKNDTKVAAGLGVKYNNFTLDGVISASTTGDVNGNAVLSQASLTYNF